MRPTPSTSSPDSFTSGAVHLARDFESDEGRAFLQRRVALLGLVGMALGGFFWLTRVVGLVVQAKWAELIEPSMLLHLAGSLSLGILWPLLRGHQRSPRLIQQAESACLFLSSVSYTTMGAFIPVQARPDLIVVLAMGFGVQARAVFVPSTGRRTLLVTLLVGLPLLTLGQLTMLLNPPATLPFDFGEPGGLGLAATVAFTVSAWWALVTALATLTSRVIYGLRREAAQARQLGQYTLEEKLGEGGMGVVYRARHALLRRPTAVKLLRPDPDRPDRLERFEREVQITAGLTHPNTVTVFDYGHTPEGHFYYAMEYLDGANLDEVVEADGPQPWGRVVSILRQVLGALSEAHGVGLIHRDIKPANIILSQRGGVPDVAKVVDFGLVKEVESPSSGPNLTQVGALAGTPRYMAPETILDAADADARSDLYAVGAVAFFLLTGEPVFDGETTMQICTKHLRDPPDSPSERLGRPLPAQLEALVMASLAKDPAERPQSAKALLERLGALAVDGDWTTERAAQWWASVGQRIRCERRQRIEAVSQGGLTIDVAERR